MQTSIQGELQHKFIKRRFARTNKRRFTKQLAASEVRERLLRRVAQRLAAHRRHSEIRSHQPARHRKRAHTEISEEDGEEAHSTIARYVIANTTREGENVLEWVHTNRTDIAAKVWRSG
jgi:CRP-like cAMP-binding protein